jgi:N-acyl-D-amino-acid deacylase
MSHRAAPSSPWVIWPHARPRRIDASGLIVAPGFIDCHTHDDLLLLEHPAAHPKLLQGVTTVVAGNCGVSLAPVAPDAPPSLLNAVAGSPLRHPTMAAYMADLRAAQPAVNAAVLAGHTTLRQLAMGLDRAADATRSRTYEPRCAKRWPR